MAGERIERVALSAAARQLRPYAVVKRTLDLGLACILLVAASLPMALVALGLFLSGSTVIQTSRRVGCDHKSFALLSFPLRRRVLRHLPMLINVLKGDMSFVGPRPVVPEESKAQSTDQATRFDVRPGFVCLQWLRVQANIAYEPESAADAEYVRRQSFLTDLGILLRACVALIPWMAGREAGPAGPAPETVDIAGIRFNNLSMAETLETFLDFAGQDRPRQACFVYADCANIAARDEDYMGVLRSADLVLADGLGMNLAGRMLGTPIRENLCGTDVFPRLCAKFAGTGRGIYLLGAQPGVVEGVRDWVRQNHPGVLIVGSHHGFFGPDEEPQVIRAIAQSKADVLLVALGVPRQDKWIAEHLSETGVKLAMGVGALFDVYSGRMTRAPQWVREMGMEWCYRLCQEPARLWKRYFLGNFIFLRQVHRQLREQRRAWKIAGRGESPAAAEADAEQEPKATLPQIARHIGFED